VYLEYGKGLKNMAVRREGKCLNRWRPNTAADSLARFLRLPPCLPATASFERRKYENQKTLSPKNIKVLFGIMDRMEKFKINWFLVYR